MWMSVVCVSSSQFRGLVCDFGISWSYSLVFGVIYNLLKNKQLGDNCIQSFHLGRYIVRYTVGNLVLWRRVSGDVKRDFRTYIRRYTSQNENFEYVYPHSNAPLQFYLNFERYRPHKAACHLTKCDVINDVNPYFQQYIAGYTVANCCRYPIRRRVTKSNALSSMQM